MEVDLKPHVIQFRVYEDEGSYEGRDPYSLAGIATIIDDSACVSCSGGQVNRHLIDQLGKALHAQYGVRRFVWEHKGVWHTFTVSNFQPEDHDG